MFCSADRGENALGDCFGSNAATKGMTKLKSEESAKFDFGVGTDSAFAGSTKRVTKPGFAKETEFRTNPRPSLDLPREQNDRTVIGPYRAYQWTMKGPVVG